MKIEQILALSPVKSRFALLERALKVAPKDGHILEFGVFKGDSINFMAGLAEGRPVTGFDSFEGLPEDWKRSESSTYKKGHFNLRGALPKVKENVTLIKGFFEDTLPGWAERQLYCKAGLVHIDCDLYGGAKFVLDTLNVWIKPGTIIVFDELGNFHGGVYKDWENGEWRALNEWLKEKDRSVEPILRTNTHQVAFKTTR